MYGSEHLQDFLIILIAAVAVVSLFRRLRASAMLSYLVAGALIGPNGCRSIGWWGPRLRAGPSMSCDG